MRSTSGSVPKILITLSICLAGCQTRKSAAADPARSTGSSPSLNQISTHPAAAELDRLFPTQPASPSTDFQPTKLTKHDYLSLIAGNVDFFKNCQTPDGAIIDPVMNREWQYATPAFALASATLVAEADRRDLLDASVRAMTFATHALANRKAADWHADFYIPMLMHARLLLKDQVSAETLAAWDADFRQIVPETHYRDTGAGGNWNIVNVSGECLRREDGLVLPGKRVAQLAYIDRSLAKQQARFTKFGMYADPNTPLAYDAFPRLWLEDMMANDAYDGTHAASVRQFLLLGGMSSLLMISPTGEWPCGGRSAQHEWNEAENIVIFEINANKWHAAGRDDIAGAMKRSAHLAYQSMKRWQRPSGEMWIVKNRAEPDTRFGFEGYSSHSQYNLLAMGMLCIAYSHADDAIAERPAPCDVGGYVFDLRDIFHKIIANAGGMYVEIDTAGDPHYNATGLQRVQRKGFPLSPLSDSAADSEIGPFDYKTRELLSPGIQWINPTPSTEPTTNPLKPAWLSLGVFINGLEPKPANPVYIVKSAKLNISTKSADRIAFAIDYHITGGGDVRGIEEQYEITPHVVSGTSRLISDTPPKQTRAAFPALVFDGSRDLPVTLDGNRLEENREGSILTYTISSPADAKLALDGPRVPCHNGMMQAAIANLPTGTTEYSWRITPRNAPK